MTDYKLVQVEMDDLIKRLRIKAGMIELGELIAWGSDTALMREAADVLERLAGPAVQTEPAAWMTHHYIPLIFPSESEAAAYCDYGERPVPLYAAPQPAPDVAEWDEFQEVDDATAVLADHRKGCEHS